MAYPLTDIEFEIPQRSGEVLCLPDPSEFVATARANADLLAHTTLQIGGRALRDLRRAARARVLQLAVSYMRTLGLSASPAGGDSLWMVTGHQPFLFHPGIWFKHLLVNRLAAGGITALSIPVDSDAFEEIGADVPHADGSLRIVRETLLRTAADIPYEAQRPPQPAQWRQFLDRIAAHLQTLPDGQIGEVFSRFVAGAGVIGGGNDIGTFLTAVRRRHEGDRRYLEVAASHVSHTPEFLTFFLHLVRDGDRFADAYNRHLRAYRDRYNVRTAAQPFPDLEQDGPRVELPFWILQDGRRRTVFAGRTAGSWTLWVNGQAVRNVEEGAGIESLTGLEIRPKALTLTAFTRLCLADLFVHGVGGGRYDRVTDAVIADYFGITPPRYAVVTATLHLPLGEFDTGEQRQRLQRRLLELRHNPERALVSPSNSQRAMIEEKWRLIPALDGEPLTRRDRRLATQRIREINDQLSQVLAAERAAVERQLRDLGEAGAASAAATHRAYPFCFFPPEAVDELIDSVLSS